MPEQDDLQVYSELNPDTILDAVESAGYRCDGHVSALNSYENRVYQIGLEDKGFIIAKFYRPGRWSDESIAEEHAFTMELAEHELPVIAPLCSEQGEALVKYKEYGFAQFLRLGGRSPELDNSAHLRPLGSYRSFFQYIGRIMPLDHSPDICTENY